MFEDSSYTMDELIRATGFTARQIRYYITRKLVPGAGERGPNVRYGQETLDHLQAVKQLKAMRVEPTGRALTLDEIQQTIMSLDSREDLQMVGAGMAIKMIDTDVTSIPISRDSSDHRMRCRELIDLELNDSVCREPQTQYYSEVESHLDEFDDLLHSLKATLADILENEEDNTQNLFAQTKAEEWRRLRIPDIEIQVRVTHDPSQRRRLERIMMVLERILDHGS
jgi:DNA-binding transcriptional MerR regulator